MGNIFRFLLVLPCITLLLYSCESEIENEIQSSTEKLNLSRLELDSLQLGSYELSKIGKIGVCCHSGLAERNAEYHVNSIFYNG